MIDDLSYEKLTVIGGLLVGLIYAIRLSMSLVKQMTPLTQAIESVAAMAGKLAPDLSDVKETVEEIKETANEIKGTVDGAITKIDTITRKVDEHEFSEVSRLTTLKGDIADATEERFRVALDLQSKAIVRDVTREMAQMQGHFYQALSKAIAESEADGVTPQEVIRLLLRFLGDMNTVGLKALSTAPLSPLAVAEKKSTGSIATPEEKT